MRITPLELPGLLRIDPVRHSDSRGYFVETYRADVLAKAGADVAFIQENQSLSQVAGTVRGLHYQLPPAAQAKLVRVIRGRVLDVAVDLRRGSSSFLRHVAVELSAQNGAQLFIPVGFAHGFATLEPDTELLYKVSAPYAPQLDRGLQFDDPALGIAWPPIASRERLSAKDQALPSLAELEGTGWPDWS
ncbi:RfbC dTDP-4-dehydrorhamnose 3,5-epimerase and related enzymes [Rhabdaerophilaceae bacterium]